MKARASLVLGLGCDRGAAESSITTAIMQALDAGGLSAEDVVAAASIEQKSDEAGMLAACQRHGWPLRFYAAAELCTVAVPNPSAVVLRYMATPSVSEAAAILCAGTDQHHLVVEKFKYRCPEEGKNVTVSICRTHT